MYSEFNNRCTGSRIFEVFIFSDVLVSRPCTLQSVSVVIKHIKQCAPRVAQTIVATEGLALQSGLKSAWGGRGLVETGLKSGVTVGPKSSKDGGCST